MIVSTPAPASIVLLPAVPAIISFPVPVDILSPTVPPPVKESTPALPVYVIDFETLVPVIVSVASVASNAEASIVSAVA